MVVDIASTKAALSQHQFSSICDGASTKSRSTLVPIVHKTK
eukprot:COSAG06_NODE_36642_length_444_cov_1.498551_1_plen_40_part_10